MQSARVQYLIDSLIELLQQKNKKVLTVNDITDALFIDTDTFYRYFPGGISEIYQVCLHQLFQKLKQVDFSDWHDLMAYCVNFLDTNRLASKSVLKILKKYDLMDWLLQEVKDFIMTYPAGQRPFLINLREHPQSLELCASEVIFTLQHWIEGNFRPKGADIVERLDLTGMVLGNNLMGNKDE
ncbi:hypothetical protein MOO45_05490 [Bombilactobacillus folatiphilus]|uniref:TetR family transcriptional regulator n=1 Tax=Bombilactobacillus folatiphilus TaxID=2923362 RepID=A0ABY4P7H7_9LACO|nr:hypothetical protein [Bombilactobacillus folatiphilus]UQS81658.1 hypothetical protein MOO45_05490 [Bombilactobacillus folatiphilus]